jgi:hypothetical protein
MLQSTTQTIIKYTILSQQKPTTKKPMHSILAIRLTRILINPNPASSKPTKQTEKTISKQTIQKIMSKKPILTKIAYILLIITLTSLCQIVAAETTILPTNPNDPFNNYTICSVDNKIAYTEIFLRKPQEDKNQIMEFGNLIYFKNTLNLTNDDDYSSPIFYYLSQQGQYLIKNPNSQIILTMKNHQPDVIAESYTNRDKFSNYPGDKFYHSNTERNPSEPKPNDEINAYIHTDALFKLFYQNHPNEIVSIKILNPKYPDFTINPIFGQETLKKYSTQFILSQHYKQNITKKQEYLYYKTTPNIETILDYIFTQSPQLINNPNSKIYLNIKGNGRFLNREIIAYSRELTPDEIRWHHYPAEFHTPDEIAQKIKQSPNNEINELTFNLSLCMLNDFILGNEIIIAKTPGTDNQFGVFINIQNLKKLEPELASNFKWISTYNYNKDDSYWFTTCNGWVDTIYEPQ